jgi:hypothetical protein
VATSVDAVAKQLQDEFEELNGPKKKDTIKAPGRRLEILRELARARSHTAWKFLLQTLRKSTSGDEQLHALLALVKTADGATLEATLAALAREKDATLWQAFGEALADGPSEEAQAWLLGAGLESPSPDVLGACLEALARNPSPAALDRVHALHARHAAVPAGVDVAYRALRVIARSGDAKARTALLEAAKGPEWRLRLVAAESLPSLQAFDAEIEAAVRGLLQDEAAFVRQTAAAQTGSAKRKELATALVGLLGDPRVRTRHVAATALSRMSGLALGHDPKAWAAWAADQEPGKPETLTFPTYHGFSVISDRVVFLVDASSSMTWPWRKPTKRIDVARAELASVLKQLTPDTLFNVLVYSDKVTAWKKGEVPASPENTSAAIRWSEKAMTEPKGDTHLYEALDAAFANNPQFDTIFLLTDGNPTAGRYWTSAGLLPSVRAWTRYRRTPIHTIGLSLANEDRGMPNLTENLDVMAQLLGALASETSGEFREILTAPTAK